MFFLFKFIEQTVVKPMKRLKTMRRLKVEADEVSEVGGG
jgi:hypothetical protein